MIKSFGFNLLLTLLYWLLSEGKKKNVKHYRERERERDYFPIIRHTLIVRQHTPPTIGCPQLSLTCSGSHCLHGISKDLISHMFNPLQPNCFPLSIWLPSSFCLFFILSLFSWWAAPFFCFYNWWSNVFPLQDFNSLSLSLSLSLHLTTKLSRKVE